MSYFIHKMLCEQTKKNHRKQMLWHKNRTGRIIPAVVSHTSSTKHVVFGPHSLVNCSALQSCLLHAFPNLTSYTVSNLGAVFDVEFYRDSSHVNA